MKIKSVLPSAAVPGGIVRLEVEGLKHPAKVKVRVGGVPADVLGASPHWVNIKVPPASQDDVVVQNGAQSIGTLKVGRILASELHPVTSPVVDSSGNVYVTYSGTRGEKVPFSIFMVQPDGTKQPFLADITNPTGMAIGPDNYLYVTSRHSGTIYRSTFDKQVEKYIDGLGLATGIVFDSRGNLLAGDRSGLIYRISPEREISVLCELEASVSAYHLAMDARDVLYVTGPTLATQDCIYRVSPQGDVEIFFKGLGRPQGIGFDPKERLQVAASYQGKKGLYTFGNSTPELTVSGPMLVGFAYDPKGNNLYLVDSEKLYVIRLTAN